MNKALVAFGTRVGVIGELLKGITRGYVRARNGKLERVSSYTTRRNAAQEAAGQMSLAALMEEPEPAPEAVEEPVSTALSAPETVPLGDTSPAPNPAPPVTAQEQGDWLSLTAPDGRHLWEIPKAELEANYDGELPPNNSLTPWEGTTPPLGTWRLDPLFGDLEQLQQHDPNALRVVEDEAEGRRTPVYPQYVAWAKEGRPAPPVSILRHLRGDLVSTNRRRVLAARDAGLSGITGWFSDTNLQTGRALKHADLVKQALEAGHAVPPAVLADYPDLAPAETKEPEGETIAAEPETPEAEAAPAGNPKLAAKLRGLADSMEERIQEKLNPGVLNQRTTYRRANMAASSQADGRNMQTVQTLLRALADRHEDGTIPPILAGLTTKAQVEQVAMHGENYPDPLISDTNVRDLFAAAKGLRGVAEVRDRIRYLPDRNIGSTDWRIFLHPDEADSVMALLSLVEKKSPAFKKQYTGTSIRDRIAPSRRLATAGIMNAEQFAEARKLLGQMLKPESAEARQKREIQEKERELIGSKIPGYFPTPPAVVSRMLEEAGLEPGQKILEPSAGKGNIADAIRDAEPGADLSVVEYSPRLNDLLKLKGHNVVGSDFLEHRAPAGGYDRILMNPPFEKRQDVEHVRQAYDLLAPGGRVVAIMSEGPFFGSDRTAGDFRDWLESNGGTSEQLTAGSFYSSENPTGVNTRLVVIDKPAA